MANDNENSSTLYSIATYTGDGTTKEFIVPFPYLYVEDVHVFVDGTEISVYPVISHDDPPSPYLAHWYADNIIKFIDAPENEVVVRIQRSTNKLNPEVEFTDSSILTEEDLNIIATQLIYIVQETYDIFGSEYSSAAIYADAARSARDEALAYASNASQSATNASNYATNASNSATSSANSAASAIQAVNQINVTLDDITAAKNTAINNINSAKSTAIDAVSDKGDTQMQRLEDYASSIMVAEATATFRTATMQVSSAIPSGTIIALPNDSSGNTLSYYVGKDTLGVSWNGTDCYKNFQYEEVGNANTVSYRIKLLFPASVGDVFCFRCLNAKIDGTIADPLQPDGVTININSSGKLETALTPQAITNAIGYTAADDSAVVKLSGNQTVGGTKTFSSGLVSNSNYALRHTDADKELIITGGNTTSGGDQGAKLVLRGGQHPTLAGTFLLQARKPDNTANLSLLGSPDGTLTWNGKNVLCVEEAGTGYIRFSSGLQICWGNAAISAASTGKEVTFGKAFNATPEIFLSPRPSSATTTLYNIVPYPRSTTGFTAYLNNSSGHNTGSFTYMAIGSWS